MAAMAGAGLMGGGMSGLSLIGSLASAILPMMMKSDPPTPPAPVQPAPVPQNVPQEASKDANLAVDQEAARARSLKRRQAAQTSGLSLLSSSGTTTDTKLGGY